MLLPPLPRADTIDQLLLKAIGSGENDSVDDISLADVLSVSFPRRSRVVAGLGERKSTKTGRKRDEWSGRFKLFLLLLPSSARLPSFPCHRYAAFATRCLYFSSFPTQRWRAFKEIPICRIIAFKRAAWRTLDFYARDTPPSVAFLFCFPPCRSFITSDTFTRN